MFPLVFSLSFPFAPFLSLAVSRSVVFISALHFSRLLCLFCVCLCSVHCALFQFIRHFSLCCTTPYVHVVCVCVFCVIVIRCFWLFLLSVRVCVLAGCWCSVQIVIGTQLKRSLKSRFSVNVKHTHHINVCTRNAPSTFCYTIKNNNAPCS